MATGRIPDPNTAPLTAKGDLYTYSTVPARQAVGSDGDTLVADSAATTGLRWQGNFAAGKNAIINGDFRINQRAFSSTTTHTAYGFDRFLLGFSGGTATYSAQTFTAGTAPVTGYESINFARLVTASQSAAGDWAAIIQRIEDVRTFANQTVTISFWAKASTGTPKVGPSFEQNFGSGGSANVATSASSATQTITTSWARYSFTINVPSISGKTIGTGSNLALYLFTSCGTTISSLGYAAVGIQNVTIDFWGVQLELGSVATAFQTATGTLAGELAACQRYYWRQTAISGTYARFNAAGLNQNSTTNTTQMLTAPVNLRAAATSVEYANIAVYDGATVTALSSLTLDHHTANTITLQANVASGLTAYRPYCLIANNNSSAYIGISAEL